MKRPAVATDNEQRTVYCGMGVQKMRDSIRYFRIAGATNAAEYAARALKSAQGAQRHAELRADRSRRSKGGAK